MQKAVLLLLSYSYKFTELSYNYLLFRLFYIEGVSLTSLSMMFMWSAFPRFNGLVTPQGLNTQVT